MWESPEDPTHRYLRAVACSGKSVFGAVFIEAECALPLYGKGIFLAIEDTLI